MITDARGKILRVGDTVHKVAWKRSISKGAANGRVLDDIPTRKIHDIIGEKVQLRATPRAKYLVAGDGIIKH